MFLINSETMKPNHGYLFSVLNSCMERGIRVNTKLLPELETNLNEVSVRLRERGISSAYSPKSLDGYFRGLGNWRLASELFDLTSMTWQINADTLGIVEGDYSAESNTIRDIVEYRSLDNTVKLLRGIRASSDTHNIVHPALSVADTGRVSYSNPPLMNVPNVLRDRLILPPEGCVLVSVDIKSQEPWIAFNWFGASACRALLTASDDLYINLFKTVAGIEVSAYYGYSELPESKRISEVLPCYTYKGNKVTGVQNVLATPKGLLPARVQLQVEGRTTPLALDAEWDKATTCNGIKRAVGKVDVSSLSFAVSAELRKILKQVLMLAIYKGSLTAASKQLAGSYGAKLTKHVRGLLTKIPDDITASYFGSPIAPDKKNSFQRSIQATGADILALLVKRFESSKPSDAELYYTRHDELVFAVKHEAVKNDGGANVKAQLMDLLAHKIDGWEPFRVNCQLQQEI